MDSLISSSEALFQSRLCSASVSSSSSFSSRSLFPCLLLPPIRILSPPTPSPCRRFSASAGRRRSPSVVAASSSTLMSNSVPPKNGLYTVGDFMTKKEHLHVVKPSTTIDEALENLVENRITGFPVIDDDWKLVGVVSDYDLLALDSISEKRTLFMRENNTKHQRIPLEYWTLTTRQSNMKEEKHYLYHTIIMSNSLSY